jgi:hypothetical protein
MRDSSGEKMRKGSGSHARRLIRIFYALAAALCGLAGLLLFGILDFLYDPEFFRNGFKPAPSDQTAPGSVRVSPDSVRAGKGPKTVILDFVCGPGGISEGGGLKLVPCRLVDFGEKGKRAVWMFSSGWGLLQNRHPRMPNYFSCHLQTSGSAALDVAPLGFFPWRGFLRLAGRELLRGLGVRIEPLDVVYFYLEMRKIRIRVTGDRLQEGDRVTIVLGDTRRGSRGWTSPAHPIGTELLVEVDEKAMGTYRRVEPAPVLATLGGQASRLEVLLSAESGGEGRVLVKAVDGRGDEDSAFRGTLQIEPSGGMEIIGKSQLGEGEGGLLHLRYRVNGPGLYRVRVRAGDIQGLSNALTAGGEAKLFWGDLHVHSALCDGSLDPAAYYRKARDVMALDFAAITSHDTMERIEPSGREEEWELLEELRERFTEPGRFVVLLGYEWSDHRHGHRGVYFAPDEPDPRVYAWVKKESDDPEKLRELLAAHDCLVIPHHTAWRRIFLTTSNWLKFIKMKIPDSYEWWPADEESQRLAEIYSMHGSSEVYGGRFPITHGDPGRFFPARLRKDGSRPGYGNYIQEALAAGLRLGVIAGSDRHDYATDERSHPVDVYPGGLTGVWAEELTPEALWKSLWNRRCYGTSGARIVLEFFADGLPMGSEYFCTSAPRLSGRVLGTAPIASVDLIRHDASGYSIALSGGGRGELDEGFDIEEPPPRGETFYYLRVEQEDGHCAWSSPIWLRR